MLQSMHKLSLLVVGSMLLLTACSTTNVKPSYVSPSKYQALDCSQLQAEYQRIEQYIASGVQGSSSRVGTGIGIGLGGGWSSGGGWGVMPSISINMGQATSTKRSETARLLGEQDAIAQAAKFKNCSVHLATQSEKQTTQK